MAPDKNSIKYISLPLILVFLLSICYVSFYPTLNQIRKIDVQLSNNVMYDVENEGITITDVESNVFDEEFSPYSNGFFGFIFNKYSLKLKSVYIFYVVPVFLDILALPPR